MSGASVSTYVNRKMACSPENIEAKLREYFRQEDEREQAAARKEDFQLDTGYKPPPFPRMHTRLSSTHSRSGNW